jgi:mono/diheme cytochrome c family protein
MLSACATQPVAEFTAAGALPPGDGRAILENQCLVCHELDALDLFADYYGQDQWRSLVLTMRANGANVNDAEVEVLAAYLSQHFGTGE